MNEQTGSTFAATLSHLVNRLRDHLTRMAERRTIPEEVIIVTTALIVGIGTGLGAVIFIWLLRQIETLRGLVIDNLGLVIGLLSFMTLAGLLVGSWLTGGRGKQRDTASLKSWKLSRSGAVAFARELQLSRYWPRP